MQVAARLRPRLPLEQKGGREKHRALSPAESESARETREGKQKEARHVRALALR